MKRHKRFHHERHAGQADGGRENCDETGGDLG